MPLPEFEALGLAVLPSGWRKRLRHDPAIATFGLHREIECVNRDDAIQVLEWQIRITRTVFCGRSTAEHCRNDVLLRAGTAMQQRRDHLGAGCVLFAFVR